MFLILFLLLMGNVALAQNIDCSSYQRQLDDFNNEINTATKALADARANMDNCQSIDQVVQSNEYKAAVAAEAQAITPLPVTIDPTPVDGVNWGGKIQ